MNLIIGVACDSNILRYSPDYDAPSPEADEMELELPEDGAPAAVIEVHDPAGGSRSIRTAAAAAASAGSNGDLNSRLSSMMDNIPGMVR